MEITRRENLMVESIRAERFGPDPLLHDAVVRGRATLDGPLLPGRPSGDAAGCCCGDHRAWHDGPGAVCDVFEFAPRDAGGLTYPDPPSGEVALPPAEAGAASSVSGGWVVGNLLDVLA